MPDSERTSHRPRTAPSRPRRRARSLPVALGVGLAILATACSSNGATPAQGRYGAPAGVTSTGMTAGVTPGGAFDLDTRTTSIGSVVVDSSGYTLYVFARDTGTTPTCTGSCAGLWPAAKATANPTKSAGITAPVSAITAAYATGQLALGGHPLYRYSGDTRPGDTNGQGIGGIWFALKPNGQRVG